ncbi:MAG: ABC transporter ATP-binding protein [Acetatifactor sp.]|nr:ABC transporter ATP-binding protein [Acetatifactor sp.]
MIRADGVGKRFGEKEVLREVNLQIGKGEIFGLLGPSGAGKTTLIKILTGQLAADCGEVFIAGKDAGRLTGGDRKKIGIMMDSFGVYERFTCYENLKLFAQLFRIPEKEIGDRLKEVGLQDAVKTPAGKLSKGMRSRLQLARVFLQKPELLFLDEPTGGLDPGNAEEIHRLILDKKREGCTIFLTTHNMTEAEKLCDSIALLNEGKIVERGMPKEICRKYDRQRKLCIHRYDGVEEELSNGRDGAERLYQLLWEGLAETVHSTEPDLESVFMELTGRKLNL